MSTSPDLQVRPARPEDIAGASVLAAGLVRMHHAADPARFFEPPGRIEDGYARWLSRELGRESALVWIAARGDEIVGYVYATIEERNWSMLLDDHARLHDVFVAEHARGAGVATQLVSAVAAALRARGITRIVLDTMTANHPAQRLFAKLGFRPTMIEMTWTGPRDSP